MTSDALSLVLRHRVEPTDLYGYLPFDVPEGVNRVQVEVSAVDRPNVVGLGLFDSAGCGYQSPGFRGVNGGERLDCFVTATDASPGFVPGPVRPGRWTVLLPVMTAARCEVTVTVRLGLGPQRPSFRPGAECGVILEATGWYRGDLHCHTPASSDAWSSGSALTPTGWGVACRSHGLDFVALTDHNSISQNFHLARDSGDDTLLIAGEEMTNWRYGHATVSGLDVGAWLDFRQAPDGVPLPLHGRRISEFLAVARSLGAYVSAAHPLRPEIPWQFLAEAARDPSARTDGLEIWNGLWQAAEERALRTWDELLRLGWRIWANGGSDLHGVTNGNGKAVGKPTTVVYADRLSSASMVAALRAGRSFVTRSPDGVEVYLEAVAPDGTGTFTGGTLWADPTDPIAVNVLVRRASGMRLVLTGQDGPVHSVPIEYEEQAVRVGLPMPGRPGFVRAEVRGRSRPHRDPALAELDMEAFTNPILLRPGRAPGGVTSEYAPPPARPGPRRTVG